MLADTDNDDTIETAPGDARLQRLCASLSHDLNNYVGAIQGYVELVKLDLEGQDETLSYLDCVLESCRKITTRTSLLENFAQNQKIAATGCDLNEILPDLIQSLEGLSFQPLIGSAWAVVDPGLLGKTLQQLYQNSVEATLGAQPTLCLSLSRDASGAIIMTFEDDGVGIDGALGDKIFDPYITTKGKGRGFGLSWVQGWVGRMGGRIEIHSRAPKPGTAVRLQFAACQETL